MLFQAKNCLIQSKKCFSIHFFILNVQFWQTIYRLTFQLVHRPSIFLGVLQTAMSKKAGDGLDIGTIIQNIHSKAVASTMPTDTFVDTCTFYPSFYRFATTLICWQIENGGV